MTDASDAGALGVEREALRARLRTQRRLIARQLESGRMERAVFPRSMTMRLLMEHPAMTRRLLARTAVLVLCSQPLRAFVLTSVRRLAAFARSSRG